MNFVFDEARAAQAVQYLVRKNGGRMNFGVMLKVLYLADRRSLIETGYPITGDRMISMENGTLLSAVYDRIKQEFQHPAWKGLRRDDRLNISCAGDPETGKLSQYDQETLDKVFAEFGSLSFFELRTLTHRLPEYEDPGTGVNDVRAEVIFESEGFTQEEIEGVADQAETLRLFRSLAG